MDDFVVSNLYESKNEWCGRLVSILTPLVTGGMDSIFKEAWNMCEQSNEQSKYLMTFQNMLARIPKWNNTIIDEECKRIMETSGCNYLEDLITCVHIIQLKVLTCIRVGNKQKKIDISIPKLGHFVHRVYINVARKVYSNIYLYERNINDLQIQKNRRELEIIVQECILVTIRESIPTESIIKAYMDESMEEEEEVIVEPVIEDQEPEKIDDSQNIEKKSEEKIELPVEELPPVLSVNNLDEEKVITRLTFNDTDVVSDGTTIDAPKTIERLEEISRENNERRKMEDEMDEDSDTEEDLGKIKIHMDDDVKLNDIFDLDAPAKSDDHVSLDGIEDL
jgi:hypothetical protein|uniref:Uncharacterized protein n=1 Tax=viral metagenome TaxID=1070528 RepID=A0A6C0CNU1_9ZZZZ